MAMTYDEIIQHLDGLNRRQLRQLAWEALLLSDGPEPIKGGLTDSPILVSDDVDSGGFVIRLSPSIHDMMKWKP